METSLPVGTLETVPELDHPGEEGLCLGRLEPAGAARSVLVAGSVLPWKGAGKYWPGLPDAGQAAEFLAVLEHHVARIAAERRPGESLIWGGDFNQPLTPPFDGFTHAGAAALRDAFESFGLVALTGQVESLAGRSFAIDHLAVSAELVDQAVATVHRPRWDRGRLSDQAAYTAEVRLPAGTSRPKRLA
jgi:hypothetical protein